MGKRADLKQRIEYIRRAMAEDGTKSAADVLWSARLQEAERELAELAVNPDEQAKPAMRSTANPPPIGYVDQD